MLPTLAHSGHRLLATEGEGECAASLMLAGLHDVSDDGFLAQFPCTPPDDAALPPGRNVRLPAAPGSGFAARPEGCSRRSPALSWDRASRAVSPARRWWRPQKSRASSWRQPGVRPLIAV